jgi:hypothetical protein
MSNGARFMAMSKAKGYLAPFKVIEAVEKGLSFDIEADINREGDLFCDCAVSDVAKKPTALAFDEASHRLFVGTRDPAKLIVLNSDSGRVVANYPAAAMVDDMAYDSQHKRIYFAGTEFLDVFQQTDPDHYDHIGHIPTAFRAKTAVLIPELNKYYLAIPHHEKQVAELRVYEVLP